MHTTGLRRSAMRIARKHQLGSNGTGRRRFVPAAIVTASVVAASLATVLAGGGVAAAAGSTFGYGGAKSYATTGATATVRVAVGDLNGDGKPDVATANL